MEEISLSPSCVLIIINIAVFSFLTIVFICLGIIHRKSDSDKENFTVKETLKERLNSLLTVKSIVTLILTEVFAYRAIACMIDQQQFMTVYTVVIAFYFGTQVQKNQDAAKNVKEDQKE